MNSRTKRMLKLAYKNYIEGSDINFNADLNTIPKVS